MENGIHKEYSFFGGPILTLKEKNYGRRFVCEISRPDELEGSISNADSPYEVIKREDENQEPPKKMMQSIRKTERRQERDRDQELPKKMTGRVKVDCKDATEDGQSFLTLTAVLSDYREGE